MPKLVEMKVCNPRFGCVRIAQKISQAFSAAIDKDVVRRVLAKRVECSFKPLLANPAQNTSAPTTTHPFASIAGSPTYASSRSMRST